MKNLIFIFAIILSWNVLANEKLDIMDFCDPAGELMSKSLPAKDFQAVCKIIVKHPLCLFNVKQSKRLDCTSKIENTFSLSTNLEKKKQACIDGIGASFENLGKFIVELAKSMGHSGVSALRYFTDPVYHIKANRQMGSNVWKGSKFAGAFLKSSAMYVHKEYPANYAKYRDPYVALGATLEKPIKKLISDSLHEMLSTIVPQYNCMNGAAKVETVCKLGTTLLVPPLFLLTWLKLGPAAIKLSQNASLISKFKLSFEELNGMRKVVATKKNAPPSNKPLSVASKSAAATKKAEVVSKYKEIAETLKSASASKPIQVELQLAVTDNMSAFSRGLSSLKVGTGSFPNGKRTVTISSPEEAKALQDLMSKYPDVVTSAQAKSASIAVAASGTKFKEVDEALKSASASKPVEIELQLTATDNMSALSQGLRTLNVRTSDSFSAGGRTVTISSPEEAKALQDLLNKYSDAVVSAGTKGSRTPVAVAKPAPVPAPTPAPVAVTKFKDVDEALKSASASKPVEIELQLTATDNMSALSQGLRNLNVRTSDSFSAGGRTVTISSPEEARALQDLLNKYSDAVVSAGTKGSRTPVVVAKPAPAPTPTPVAAPRTPATLPKNPPPPPITVVTKYKEVDKVLNATLSNKSVQVDLDLKVTDNMSDFFKGLSPLKSHSVNSHPGGRRTIFVSTHEEAKILQNLMNRYPDVVAGAKAKVVP